MDSLESIKCLYCEYGFLPSPYPQCEPKCTHPKISKRRNSLRITLKAKLDHPVWCPRKGKRKNKYEYIENTL